jgi:hypothetical protein
MSKACELHSRSRSQHGGRLRHCVLDPRGTAS